MVTLESFKLRMVPVSFGLSEKNNLSEQPLSPQRKKALPVKIFWMECPESHSSGAPPL